YELDVVAPPLSGVTATVRGTLAPWAIASAAAGIEASTAAPEAAARHATATPIGAARSVAVSGRGVPAESVTVRVPDWADQATVDVAMPREQRDDLTDFGVTDFDSTAQALGRLPLPGRRRGARAPSGSPPARDSGATGSRRRTAR